MKYIITGLLLMAFTGCGSDDKNEINSTKVEVSEGQNQKVVKESSPQNMEKAKTPPAIPQI
jgi:hypothetical protein